MVNLQNRLGFSYFEFKIRLVRLSISCQKLKSFVLQTAQVEVKIEMANCRLPSAFAHCELILKNPSKIISKKEKIILKILMMHTKNI